MYDQNLDYVTDQHLNDHEGEHVTFTGDIFLALPTDTEQAQVISCEVSGTLIDNDHESEFIPHTITDAKTGEAYTVEQLVDVCDLFDLAVDANSATTQADEIDRLHEDFKHGYYVTANQ